MANIGSFTKKNANYSGKIQTLTFSASITLVPNQGNKADSPAFRAFVGDSEVGAAWAKTSASGNDYYALRLEDPTFTNPIYVNLIEQPNGSYDVLWSRPKPASKDSKEVPPKVAGRRAAAPSQPDLDDEIPF